MRQRNHLLKILLLATGIIFHFNTASAQKSDSTANLSRGKWSVCTSMTLLDHSPCTSPYTGYTFHRDGTYKESQQMIFEGKSVDIAGKWNLTGNILTIDQNDRKNYKAHPITHQIVWVSNDRFYSAGEEGPGGPNVYTYFDRIK